MTTTTETTTLFVEIPSDPLLLGEDATHADLRAYAEQLGIELSAEFDEPIEVCVCAVSRARCSDAAVQARVREIHAGDDWIQVLRRSAAEGVQS